MEVNESCYEKPADKLKSEAEILTDAYNAVVDGLPWEMIASDPFFNYENFMVSFINQFWICSLMVYDIIADIQFG